MNKFALGLGAICCLLATQTSLAAEGICAQNPKLPVCKQINSLQKNTSDTVKKVLGELNDFGKALVKIEQEAVSSTTNFPICVGKLVIGSVKPNGFGACVSGGSKVAHASAPQAASPNQTTHTTDSSQPATLGTPTKSSGFEVHYGGQE